MSAVAAPARVERWTPVSASFTAGLAALLALLAFAPLVLGENSIDNLIQLYFLVTLAIMWNALAGYGGATRDPLPAAAQPRRRVSAGDPRRRGGREVDRRPRAARQGRPLRSRGGGLRGCRRGHPRLAAVDPRAGTRLRLRRQLVGEDDLHGARGRARHVRGADHRRDHALPAPDVRLELRRLVL